MMFHRFSLAAPLILLAALATTSNAVACPFCNAVSQTLRQEMEVMDAVVIATAMQSDATRNKETGEILMKIDVVLKGDDLLKVGSEVKAVYYGEVKVGRRFMLSGVDPPDLQWSCLPINERSEKYIIAVTKLDDDPLERLRFFYDYLEDKDSMLARDTYDEFAIAPYSAIKELAPEMDHDQLVKWLQEPEMSTDRKRLYLTMLGVCGSKKDLPMLETLMTSTQKSTRGGLDALIACYLTLAGEQGLPLVNKLFLANKKAPYADTYAAIMAVRFHGTEGEVIARSALVESLHHVLDRADLADLVIPDLARWKDWSQIERLKNLFINADEDNNWVRVPVVNYLRACPLPAAAEAMKELEKLDPESVRRANTFFAIPVPAKDTGSSSSSVRRKATRKYAALPIVRDHQDPGSAKTGTLTASVSPVVPSFPPQLASDVSSSNPWTLLHVLAMALAALMIAQFLLLTGGAVVKQA
ncbi:hypothetical protein [Planctomycetes bacterium K23_9]|uniref:Uncharacterized protein n=1 Tax=Stieleria marina TaxID=1930275 RepID=A0A517NLT5_9BACT|nr:hypothetical protein K239x_00210 [Planctomycetes bacterium K23_9]